MFEEGQWGGLNAGVIIYRTVKSRSYSRIYAARSTQEENCSCESMSVCDSRLRACLSMSSNIVVSRFVEISSWCFSPSRMSFFEIKEWTGVLIQANEISLLLE